MFFVLKYMKELTIPKIKVGMEFLILQWVIEKRALERITAIKTFECLLINDLNIIFLKKNSSSTGVIKAMFNILKNTERLIVNNSSSFGLINGSLNSIFSYRKNGSSKSLRPSAETINKKVILIFGKTKVSFSWKALSFLSKIKINESIIDPVKNSENSICKEILLRNIDTTSNIPIAKKALIRTYPKVIKDALQAVNPFMSICLNMIICNFIIFHFC